MDLGKTPTDSKVADNKPSVDTMTTAEIRVHMDRCERLTARPELLSRLPDAGESIRNRLDAFARELDRRTAAAKREVVTQPLESELAPIDAAPPVAQVCYMSNVAAIMDKYRDRRIPVEETVRRMYGGSISEREMQRIVSEVPPNYFLTYSETLEREREMAKQARREELEKLRQQSAARRS